MTETLDITITKVAKSRLAETDFNNLPFGRTFSDHMFVADYADGEWKNFQIVPYGEIGLSPAISALHYGQSFFEGLKAYKHVDGKVSVFRPYMNAARFNKSAERLCMPELPEDIFVQSIAALVDLDKDWIPAKPNHSLYIRPFMFAIDPYLGVAPSKTYKYMVICGPTGPYFSKPLRVKIETHYSRAVEGGFGYAKAAGNYGGAMLPLKKAVEEGYDQLIWTDGKEHAYMEELGAANVMFLLDGKLITPSTRDTILKGVTRDTVLTLAREWGYTVEERRVSIAEVLEGAKNGKLTDAFGAGTAATIAPIGEIEHGGNLYTLPDPSQREFSKKVLKTLDEIRYGVTADPYGWNYMV
ncbi:branched chain amino acid aminotransferase [Mucilaginibacter sp. PPCGB 2223]|uniref:branched-chain amino acid aminotransferase n=1 Tax=Mucilaginibacter sp. PPCGB 2223 TaxID=1886027 RepID=UPI000826FCDE|nr:branched-chain amino acid aminotransferase [Mucilaginibacter sp. PPCGB 2223]OCX51165.1 branched chain amino acid aminotransferase [Mucilaginibacter sp. PPCGB 2223]